MNFNFNSSSTIFVAFGEPKFWVIFEEIYNEKGGGGWHEKKSMSFWDNHSTRIEIEFQFMYEGLYRFLRFFFLLRAASGESLDPYGFCDWFGGIVMVDLCK